MKKNNLLIPLIPTLILILIVVVSFLTGSRYNPDYSGPYQVEVIDYEDSKIQIKTRICFPVMNDYGKYSTGKVLNNISNFSTMMSNLHSLNFINLASLIISQHSNHKSLAIQTRSKFPVIIIPSGITHLNTERAELEKELCSHGFITVVNGICTDTGKIEPISNLDKQMIEEVITRLEAMNELDAENNSMMDLSQIGVMQNQIEEISLINNINDDRIKAIICCDMESGSLYFPETSKSDHRNSFSHHKQSNKPVHFTRTYIKITKYIWNGITEHMELHGFNKRPMAKAIINTVNRIQNRFQQRK